jgi:putative transposase
MALLYFTKVSTCSSMAEVFLEASHNCLTRMLNDGWSGQILLDRALRVLFTVVSGYLMVDDTVVDKPYAQLLSEAGWVWSSKRKKVVYGVSVVLVVWTDEQIRIPIGFRGCSADAPGSAS